MNRLLTNAIDFVDKAAIIRRLVLGLSCWMTWDAYRWAAQFATYTDKAGVETAAMIAAVTAPVSWITVAVFKTYTEGKV